MWTFGMAVPLKKLYDYHNFLKKCDVTMLFRTNFVWISTLYGKLVNVILFIWVLDLVKVVFHTVPFN